MPQYGRFTCRISPLHPQNAERPAIKLVALVRRLTHIAHPIEHVDYELEHVKRQLCFGIAKEQSIPTLGNVQR